MNSISYVTAQKAISGIESGNRVFIQGGAATPQKLIAALVEKASWLSNIEIVHIHTEGAVTYARPEYAATFKTNCFFAGSNIRPYLGAENVQYIPMFLSEIPTLFRSGKFPIDVALIQVSLPDDHGYCSLGVSVDITKAATDVAGKIIAIVNPNMPRSHGDGQIHLSRLSAAIYDEAPIFESKSKVASAIEKKIGLHVASLIEDGATLQMGIGAIPNAVLDCLRSHKNLGIHTEMFSDGILPLVESGVINGSMKKQHKGKIISSFAIGTKKLYGFIHDNPSVNMLDVGYVNSVSVISAQPRMTAINSAVEIDLTGQVCSDSIGTSIYSGVGGQIDFIRGASLSEGGKPIIAMRAVTDEGISKIVPVLKPGAGVVTTRAHIHYVVTENGIADLYGKNLAERAKSLIGIADPLHQESLEKTFFENFLKHFSSVKIQA